MPAEDLCYRTSRELAGKLQRQKISPVEVTRRAGNDRHRHRLRPYLINYLLDLINNNVINNVHQLFSPGGKGPSNLRTVSEVDGPC
jgi:hypothetical protein